MHMTADEALVLPSEARTLLADRLVESLDPADEAFAQVRQTIAR